MRERAAIVTGGGTGIGRAAALALHRDGCKIVIAGRRPEPLEETRELVGDDCVVHAGDIREPEVADALIDLTLEEFGRIDVLVNNAGGQFVAPAEDITPNGWARGAPSQPGRPVVPHAAGRDALDDRARRRPHHLGRAVPDARHPGHGALVRRPRRHWARCTSTLSLEWGKYGIGVVCVAPGWIDTEGMRSYGDDLADVADLVPMGRMGTAEEVGEIDRLPGVAGGRVHHRHDDRDRRRHREHGRGVTGAAISPLVTLTPWPSPARSTSSDALRDEAYLADRGLATVIHLSLTLEKPLLLEGEAGVGKTEPAKALAELTGARLIRLQCYEGIDVAHALYDWSHARQLLYIRTLEAGDATERRPDAARASSRRVPRAAAAAGRHRALTTRCRRCC